MSEIQPQWPEQNTPEQLKNNELDRIHGFCEALSAVESCRLLETKVYIDDDEYPVESSIRRFELYERSAEPAFLLASSLSPFAGQSPRSLYPRVARGGHRSRHGVFFADIEMDGGTRVPVAVKPFDLDDHVGACARDYFSNCAIREFGFESLQPAGIVSMPDRSYALTVLDESLSTLDSINWKVFYPDTTKHPGMRQLNSQIARQLAFMHSTGRIKHGDFAHRNIATTAEGNLFFIDWEGSVQTSSPGRDAEMRYSNSYPDIKDMLKSICLPKNAHPVAGIEMLYGKDDCDWWNAFREIFFDEYLAFRQDCAVSERMTPVDIRETNDELQQLVSSIREEARILQAMLSR